MIYYLWDNMYVCVLHFNPSIAWKWMKIIFLFVTDGRKHLSRCDYCDGISRSDIKSSKIDQSWKHNETDKLTHRSMCRHCISAPSCLWSPLFLSVFDPCISLQSSSWMCQTSHSWFIHLNRLHTPIWLFILHALIHFISYLDNTHV